MVTLPCTVEPPAGVLIPTVGEVVSVDVVEVVTWTRTDVVVLPAPSRALAEIMCDPPLAPVEFHCAENGASVSSAPVSMPSTRNWTPVTPTSSEALAVMLTKPETAAPDNGAVSETTGDRVSLGCAETTLENPLSLALVSRAVTANQ